MHAEQTDRLLDLRLLPARDARRDVVGVRVRRAFGLRRLRRWRFRLCRGFARLTAGLLGFLALQIVFDGGALLVHFIAKMQDLLGFGGLHRRPQCVVGRIVESRAVAVCLLVLQTVAQVNELGGLALLLVFEMACLAGVLALLPALPGLLASHVTPELMRLGFSLGLVAVLVAHIRILPSREAGVAGAYG